MWCMQTFESLVLFFHADEENLLVDGFYPELTIVFASATGIMVVTPSTRFQCPADFEVVRLTWRLHLLENRLTPWAGFTGTGCQFHIRRTWISNFQKTVRERRWIYSLFQNFGNVGVIQNWASINNEKAVSFKIYVTIFFFVSFCILFIVCKLIMNFGH